MGFVGWLQQPDCWQSNHVDAHRRREPSDQVQLFEQGLIMARADKGTFEMHGEIYKRHTNLTDREQARLGWITSDEQPTADGRGRVSYFSYGRITGMQLPTKRV